MKRKLPLACWWTLNTLNTMIKRKVVMILKKGDLEAAKKENLNKKSMEQVGSKQRQKCWHRSVPVAVSRGPGGGGGGGHGDRGGGGSGDGDTGGDGAGGFV